jgi:hypothetical protein
LLQARELQTRPITSVSVDTYWSRHSETVRRVPVRIGQGAIGQNSTKRAPQIDLLTEKMMCGVVTLMPPRHRESPMPEHDNDV